MEGNTSKQKRSRASSPPPLLGRHREPIKVPSWAMSMRPFVNSHSGVNTGLTHPAPNDGTQSLTRDSLWLDHPGCTVSDASIAAPAPQAPLGPSQCHPRTTPPLAHAKTGDIGQPRQQGGGQAGPVPHRHRLSEREMRLHLWLRDTQSVCGRPDPIRYAVKAAPEVPGMVLRETLFQGICPGCSAGCTSGCDVGAPASEVRASSSLSRAQQWPKEERVPVFLQPDFSAGDPHSLPAAPSLEWPSFSPSSGFSESNRSSTPDEPAAPRPELNWRFQHQFQRQSPEPDEALAAELDANRQRWTSPELDVCNDSPPCSPRSAASSELTTWTEWQEMERTEEEAKERRGAKIGADGRRWVAPKPNVVPGSRTSSKPDVCSPASGTLAESPSDDHEGCDADADADANDDDDDDDDWVLAPKRRRKTARGRPRGRPRRRRV